MQVRPAKSFARQTVALKAGNRLIALKLRLFRCLAANSLDLTWVLRDFVVFSLTLPVLQSFNVHFPTVLTRSLRCIAKKRGRRTKKWTRQARVSSAHLKNEKKSFKNQRRRMNSSEIGVICSYSGGKPRRRRVQATFQEELHMLVPSNIGQLVAHDLLRWPSKSEILPRNASKIHENTENESIPNKDSFKS